MLQSFSDIDPAKMLDPKLDFCQLIEILLVHYI